MRCEGEESRVQEPLRQKMRPFSYLLTYGINMYVHGSQCLSMHIYMYEIKRMWIARFHILLLFLYVMKLYQLHSLWHLLISCPIFIFLLLLFLPYECAINVSMYIWFIHVNTLMMQYLILFIYLLRY